MRTRRSPRNQYRLWKLLTPRATVQPKEAQPALTADDVAGMFWLSKHSRRLMLADIAKRK